MKKIIILAAVLLVVLLIIFICASSMKTESDTNWNKLWKLYGEGKIETTDYDIFVLMDYYGGIEGEGHYTYFMNNEDNLDKINKSLKKQLTSDLYDNYLKAYNAYIKDVDDDSIIDNADEYFYQNEKAIEEIIYDYANNYFK